MNTDDKIRAILRMEADTVDPSPAGWDAIQAGIASRTTRSWWMRGIALTSAAALVVGVLAYVTIDRSPRAVDQSPATPGISQTTQPTTSPTPSPTTGPNNPIGAIWPLTTTDEVAAWNADHATYPSLSTASGSALAFARNYLGAADATVVALDGSFGENRFEVRRDGTLVSTVTVKGFGRDGTAPFVAIRAESNEVHISSPAAEGRTSSPFTARGSYETVDPAIDVVLRADSSGSAPVELAKVRATTGPEGWSANVTFATTAHTGSLLVTNASLKDSGIAAASAVPLVFGTAPVTSGPAQMVAVRDGRVALLSTSTGELIRWLTDAEEKSGAQDPELSEDGKTVVYAHSGRLCSSAVMSVPVSGGTPTVLADGNGGIVSHPSSRGDVLAYVRTACDSAQRQEVVVKVGTRTVTQSEGAVLGGPVVGQRFVAWIADQGGLRVLHTIDPYGELADNPVSPPKDCTWVAPAWGPADKDGRDQLFVVTTCSPRDEVVETWLYRLDQDARNATRLVKLDVSAVTSADYAGDALLLGAHGQRDVEHVAYAYVDGTLRLIPGEAQGPTWD